MHQNAIIERVKSFLKSKEFRIFIFIFLSSLLLRVIGLKFGFPLLTHPDEDDIMDPVFNMAVNNSLKPGNFSRPNQILGIIYFFYLNIASYVRFGKSFEVAFPLYPLNFYFYARVLISFMGSMIPVVAYKIGKEFKPKVANAAAIVFAIFPLYILHSLYITSDIPITLFTLIIILFTILFLKSGNQKYLLIALFFSAVNTAEKYPGLISLGIVISGVVIRIFEKEENALPEKLKNIFIQIIKLSAIYIFFLYLVAPNIFIEYGSVIKAIRQEARPNHLGADNLGWFGNMLFYGQTFLKWSNILAIVFIGIGIYAIIKSTNRTYLVLFYGLFYWIALSALSLHWERWALPMYTTPLFLISIAIAFLWNEYSTNKKMKAFLLIVFALFFGQQMIHAIQVPIRMQFVDTRVVANEYCLQNEINVENSIYEGYTPLSPQMPGFIFEEYRNIPEGKEYIIISSRNYSRFYQEPERYQSQIQIYEDIRENNVLMAWFQPEPPPKNIFSRFEDIVYFIKFHLNLTSTEKYIGPTIEIYRIVD